MRSIRVRGGMTAAILALSSAQPLTAHPDIELRIAAVSERIAADPDNARLYLKRGELHREHRDWEAALADYAAAAEREPELTAVHLARGMMFFDAGRGPEAKTELDRFLTEQPDSAKGRIALARVRVALGDRLGAAVDYDVGITRATRTTPELYLERARALAETGSAHLDRALQGLDEGMNELGRIVTLQSYAIELEVRRGEFDGALRRLHEIAGWLPKERLLHRKGAILEAAGRTSEAATVYQEAIDAIDALPAQRRHSQPVAELRAELVAMIEKLRVTLSDSARH